MMSHWLKGKLPYWLAGAILIVGLVVVRAPLYADTTWIHDFNFPPQKLPDGVASSDGNVIGNRSMSETPVAEGSYGSMQLSVDFTYTWEGNGDDWEADGYVGQYLGFYLYNAGGDNTLTITITEHDNVGGVEVAETWEATVSTSWTGWRYIRIPVNAIGFTKTGATGNDIFDPSISLGPPIIRGVTEFRFSGNADLYIDEIIFSPSTDIWVQRIYPTMDESATSIDRALDFENLPPTFSAILQGILHTPDVTRSWIIIVNNNDADNDLGTPTDNMDTNTQYWSSGNNYFLYASPDAGTLSNGNTYTMFIRPIDTDGNVGQCEVVTFTLSGTFTPPSSTKYHRELTN